MLKNILILITIFVNLSAFSKEKAPQSSYIKVNGIKLHYLSGGKKGPLLLLIHGFPEYSGAWTPYIQKLSKNFRVVAPDMRGYNLSDKPKHVKDYKIENLINDMKEVILKFDKKAYVVAHDWGGTIAWHLTNAYPNIVKKLVIINGPHPVIYKKLYENDPDQMKALKSAWGQPEAIASTVKYYSSYRWNFEKNVSLFREKIKAPVLVLWGMKDRAVVSKNIIGLEKHVKTLKIKKFPKYGHWVNHDLPDILSKEIEQFMLGQ